MIVKNDLYDYKNRYIYQDTEFFKFSIDSILLAEFVDRKDLKGNILDICTGNGAVSLILAEYTKNNIIGFEIQKKIAYLAQLSVDENNLTKQIKIINDDAKNLNKYYDLGYFNTIVCNPPYFEYNGNMVNLQEEKTIARHEVYLTLENIFQIADYALTSKGSLYIVNRAQRLDELIILGNKYNIGIKKIQLIKTKKDRAPSLVIVKAVKNSKKHVIINDVVNIENMQTYQNIFKGGCNEVNRGTR